jgi:hypothetical protein
MMAYVHEQAQPGDTMIYNFPESSILYYNDYQLPIELVPSSPGLSADEISAQLQDATDGYRRVWLAPLIRPWWDTRGDVVTWLDRHSDRVDQQFFRGVHANLYLAPTGWKAMMTPQLIRFGDGIWLQGFRLSGKKPDADIPVLAPGDTLHLSLYWRSNGPTAIPYTVFTHLIGSDGQLYGQWDNQPVRGTYPTTDWLPGESVVDQYEIRVSPDAPAGEYQLMVGLYDPVSGDRLPVQDDSAKPDSDHVRLKQEIHIQ